MGLFDEDKLALMAKMLGVDPEQLSAMTSMMEPSAQEKRDALTNGLLSAAGAAFANGGQGFSPALGAAIQGFSGGQQGYLDQSRKDAMARMQNMQTMSKFIQDMGAQRAEKDIVAKTFAPSLPQQPAQPQFGMQDRSSGMMQEPAPVPTLKPWEQFNAIGTGLVQAGQSAKAKTYFDLAKSLQETQPKLKTTEELTDKNGQRIVVGFYDNGDSRVLEYGPKKEKLAFQGVGGETLGLDQYTGIPQTQYKHTPTPGELMTDERTRSEGAANRAQAAQHHADQKNKTQFMVVDGQVLAINPQTQTGKPLETPEGKVIPKPPKDMPTKWAEDLKDAETVLGKIATTFQLASGKDVDVQMPDGSVKTLKGDARATNPVYGSVLNEEGYNLLDPAGIDTRTAIGELRSMRLRTASGQAVTVQEYARGKWWLPKENDPPDTLRRKLTAMQAAIDIERNGLIELAKRMNYKAPAPSQQDITAEYLRRQ